MVIRFWGDQTVVYAGQPAAVVLWLKRAAPFQLGFSAGRRRWSLVPLGSTRHAPGQLFQRVGTESTGVGREAAAGQRPARPPTSRANWSSDMLSNGPEFAGRLPDDVLHRRLRS
jgi:hypothetical protein